MVGGAIRSKLIHRMSYRASVLHQLWTKRGEKNTAREFSVLTTPSLLSRGTRFDSTGLCPGHPPPAHGSQDMPVWGTLLHALDQNDPVKTTMRIHKLVKDIKTLQVK